MDLTLIPLLKGLRIGKILVQLQEAQEFILYNDIHIITRRVAYAEYNIPADSETLGEDQDGFRLQERLTLPRTLRRCVQDVHCKGVKVRHKLVFSVQLHNPDGHLSEVCPSQLFLIGCNANFHSFVPHYQSISSSLPIFLLVKTAILLTAIQTTRGPWKRWINMHHLSMAIMSTMCFGITLTLAGMYHLQVVLAAQVAGTGTRAILSRVPIPRIARKVIP
jgi:hypothetical protein